MRKEVELQARDVREQQKKNAEQELRLKERAYETVRIESIQSENNRLNTHIDELKKQLETEKKDKEAVMLQLAK